jgi:hypothetical protein
MKTMGKDNKRSAEIILHLKNPDKNRSFLGMMDKDKKRKIMKTLFGYILAALFSYCLLLTGCAGFSSGTKDTITVEDSLELKGSCIITGKVVDSNTNEPVRGANIVVYSMPKSAISDLYGQFDLIDMPDGIYTLQIFCVGYNQKIIPDIKVKPDRLIKLEIRLEPRRVKIE